MRVCTVHDYENNSIRVFHNISKAVDIIRAEKKSDNWKETHFDEDLDENNELKNVYLSFAKFDNYDKWIHDEDSNDGEHYVYLKIKEIEGEK